MIRPFAEHLQNDAVDLWRLVLRLPAMDPAAWTEDERAAAARVAEALLNIEAGARKARLELEEAVKKRPGRCRGLVQDTPGHRSASERPDPSI